MILRNRKFTLSQTNDSDTMFNKIFLVTFSLTMILKIAKFIDKKNRSLALKENFGKVAEKSTRKVYHYQPCEWQFFTPTDRGRLPSHRAN